MNPRKLITENKDKKCYLFFTALSPEGKKLYDFFFAERISLYAFKVSIARMEWMRPSDEGYDTFDGKTINDLIAEGTVKGEFAPYREHEIRPAQFEEYTDEIADLALDDPGELYRRLDAPAIAREFADHGLQVSEKAILHNFHAWLGDLKSGFRDREAFLFTPCGCNPLSFRASELYAACSDWQKTYTC